MKNLVLGCAFVASAYATTAYAEKVPLSEVVEVVEVAGMTQKQIFDSSKIWMAKAFKSSNAVIQYEDVSTGTIIGKGNMDYPCSGFWNCAAHSSSKILFTLKIDTKDNKARLTFNDLLLKTAPDPKIGLKGYEVKIYVEKDKELIEKGIKDIVAIYSQDIQTTASDSDW